ncbi:hypothetical protein ACFLX7_00895 [Chloroflexota bacterium]
MNRRLYYIPLSFVILGLLLGFAGWFTESSTIKWVVPAFGLALISIGLGLNGFLIALHTTRRMHEMDATLARIENLQEEMQREQKEQASSGSPIVSSLQALSQYYFDYMAKQKKEDAQEQ